MFIHIAAVLETLRLATKLYSWRGPLYSGVCVWQFLVQTISLLLFKIISATMWQCVKLWGRAARVFKNSGTAGRSPALLAVCGCSSLWLMIDIGKSAVRVRMAVGGCHVLGHGHLKRPRRRGGSSVDGRQTVRVASLSDGESKRRTLGCPWAALEISSDRKNMRGCEQRLQPLVPVKQASKPSYSLPMRGFLGVSLPSMIDFQARSGCERCLQPHFFFCLTRFSGWLMGTFFLHLVKPQALQWSYASDGSSARSHFVTRESFYHRARVCGVLELKAPGGPGGFRF